MRAADCPGPSSAGGNGAEKCAKKRKTEWTDVETQQLLGLFKSIGSHWSVIANYFPDKTENEVKNRFYTTLKRVATQAQLEDPVHYNTGFYKCKRSLLQFVDAAIIYGRRLSSKRGRKKNSDRASARANGFLFPNLGPPLPPLPPSPQIVPLAAQPQAVLCPTTSIVQYTILPPLPPSQACYVYSGPPAPCIRLYPAAVNQVQLPVANYYRVWG